VGLACESLGVDVFEVRELVNNLPNDPSRPSANPVRNMHVPGAGVGGHCLPKDSWLLKFGVDKYGKTPVEMKVILGARHVNDSMPIHMADLVFEALAAAGIGASRAKVSVLGYAFLEDSDDTRNTPARTLIDELERRGIGAIAIHDPYVRAEELPSVQRDPYAALQGSDCACIVTKHGEYAKLDWGRAKKLMRSPFVVDGRNLTGSVRLEELGFHVAAIGRG
jgi:UDP-N-acetyl-D-mannosaminuronic acid dehydrogenase